jgi:thymidylate synthase (FAD)
MYDLMSLVSDNTIECLDKGHVTLVDVMPRLAPNGQTADYAIVQAARVSYGDGTKTVNEDRGLIRYLMRHAHTTPFEMIEFKFKVKVPIFVGRQWARHRMSSTNEYSGRYSIMKDEFYFPTLEDVHLQSQTNKQGGNQQADSDNAQEFLQKMNDLCDKAYATYEEYLDKGLAREQARMVLPVNNYTEFYWKIDLHNLFHFLALRCDAHAQYEIRVFADAILKLIQPIVPVAVEAWNDYHDHRGALKLTRLEINEIKAMVAKLREFTKVAACPLMSDNKREQAEWVEKAAKLGFEIQ